MTEQVYIINKKQLDIVKSDCGKFGDKVLRSLKPVEPMTPLEKADGVVKSKCSLASGEFPDVAFMRGVAYGERHHFGELK